MTAEPVPDAAVERVVEVVRERLERRIDALETAHVRAAEAARNTKTGGTP